MASMLAEGRESSTQYWDTSAADYHQDTGGIQCQNMPDRADPGIEISLCGKMRLCYNPNRAGWEAQTARATFGDTAGDSQERVQHIVYRSKG